MGGVRIHPRHNKGDRSVLNTLQGSIGQDSKRETSEETVLGTGFKGGGGSKKSWKHMEFSFMVPVPGRK